MEPYFTLAAFDQPDNPLILLKQKASEWADALRNGEFSGSEIVRKKEVVSNISEFISYVEGEHAEISILRKNYNPLELDNGIGEIIMDIVDYSNSPIALTQVQLEKLRGYLQIPESERDQYYFENTTIKDLYLWYKKGGRRQEDFGSVVDDTFEGFVIYIS